MVKLLLAAPGIDVNLEDNDYETPLHHASYKGHSEVVKLLLALPGIDFNWANRPACPCLNQPAGATRCRGPSTARRCREPEHAREPAAGFPGRQGDPHRAVPCRAVPCLPRRAVQDREGGGHVEAPTHPDLPPSPFFVSGWAGLRCHVSIPGNMHFIRHDD